MTKIAILGTGIVGRTIAVKLADLGNEVTIGTRDVANTLKKEEKDGYGNPPFKVWYEGKSEDGQTYDMRPFFPAAPDLYFGEIFRNIYYNTIPNYLTCQ